jgi:hypothetical protein
MRGNAWKLRVKKEIESAVKFCAQQIIRMAMCGAAAG